MLQDKDISKVQNYFFRTTGHCHHSWKNSWNFFT